MAVAYAVEEDETQRRIHRNLYPETPEEGLLTGDALLALNAHLAGTEEEIGARLASDREWIKGQGGTIDNYAAWFPYARMAAGIVKNLAKLTATGIKNFVTSGGLDGLGGPRRPPSGLPKSVEVSPGGGAPGGSAVGESPARAPTAGKSAPSGAKPPYTQQPPAPGEVAPSASKSAMPDAGLPDSVSVPGKNRIRVEDPPGEATSKAPPGPSTEKPRVPVGGVTAAASRILDRQQAIEWMLKRGVPRKEVASLVDAMGGEIRVRTLNANSYVEGWFGTRSRPGSWIVEVGVTGDAAAVLPFDGSGKLRMLGRYRVTADIEVLESIAAPMSPRLEHGIGGTGGAIQYFAPNLNTVLQRIPVT